VIGSLSAHFTVMLCDRVCRRLVMPISSRHESFVLTRYEWSEQWKSIRGTAAFVMFCMT
jgi:hypothetical protein